MSACEERKDTDETCCLHDLGDANEHAPGRVCCWCGDVYVPHSDGPKHGIYKPSNIEVTEAERERDEARAEVERLRRSLVDLTGDKSAGDLPEKTVLGVLMQRDEARAQAASALRHADLLRREMEPCEVHHGARRACGQCLSSAEAHAKDLLAQLATEREEIRDLKARLKAARKRITIDCDHIVDYADIGGGCSDCVRLDAALDLTNKNWRKP